MVRCRRDSVAVAGRTSGAAVAWTRTAIHPVRSAACRAVSPEAECAPPFPFSAVIGQNDFKLALMACAVDPTIGGVLATGDRGSAKSTLARAFARLLRPIGEESAAAPFVELPLGASIERLTGSIDTSRLLAGEGVELTPGLLAAADGGVLYVDEVNLLADHLVDLLLDAAAFGRVQVERDGLSASQAARFILVGTMNPEEGELRPQLLDRFGLSVEIESPSEPGERREIVRRAIAFERDQTGFAARYAGADQALAEIVGDARAALAEVELSDPMLERISALCLRLGIQGMRGDIVTARTAAALAALDRRTTVNERDVETAARLALAHRGPLVDGRATRVTAEAIGEALAEPGDPAAAARPAVTTDVKRREAVSPSNASKAERASPAPVAPGSDPVAPAPDTREAPAPAFDHFARTPAGAAGRGARAAGAKRPAVDAAPVALEPGTPVDLDPIATARANVTRRLIGGGATGLTVEDLRERVRAGRDANLVLCAVDASSSVLERGRAAELRSVLSRLVADARHRRDRIGLIVFSGREARLVAPPSRNHASVLAALASIKRGGTTPLAEGIRVAHQAAVNERRRNPELRPVVLLVTDGYANVGKSGDAVGEARAAARALLRDDVSLVVIGEATSGARAFARSTGAQFLLFEPLIDSLDAA